MAPSRRTKPPEIDELFQNFEATLKSQISNIQVRSMNSTSAKSTLDSRDQWIQIIPNAIWKKFVEHCEANDLDPSMQIRDAIASHYQDLLREFRIRNKLTAQDDRNSV